MSSNPNLMDTAPGGESTQYESINTVTKPHSKQGGQLSEAQTAPADSPRDLKTGDTSKAENMRYGQAMSEEGVGGFTAPGLNSGEPGGGGEKDGPGKQRREQGYGGERDMRRDIGA